jgi:hypothetical protein
MRKKKMGLILVAALLGFFTNDPDVRAQSFNLYKIADRNTPIPGGS